MLQKTSLISFQHSQTPLQQNFVRIEDQFSRINSICSSLSKDNQILKSQLSKCIGFINQHSQEPIEEVQYASYPIQDIRVNQQKQQSPQASNLNLSQTVVSKETPIAGPTQQETQQGVQTTKYPEQTKICQQYSSVVKTQRPKKVLEKKKSQIQIRLQHTEKQIQRLNDILKNTQQKLLSLNEIRTETNQIKKYVGMKTKTSQNKSTQKKITKKQIKLDQNQNKQQINDGQVQPDNNDQQDQNNSQQRNEINCFMDMNNEINNIRDIMAGKLKSFGMEIQNTKNNMKKVSNHVSNIEKQQNSNSSEIQKLKQAQIEAKKQRVQQKQRESMGKIMKPSNQDVSIRRIQTQDDASRCGKSRMNQTMETMRQYYEEKVVEIFQEMQKLKMDYFKVLDKLQDDKNSSCQSQNSLTTEKRGFRVSIKQKLSSAGLDQPSSKLKKEVHICKKDLKDLQERFDTLMTGVNSGTKQTRTLILKPNQNKQDWKCLSSKIFKVKQQLQTNMKQLEGKIMTNNQANYLMGELQTSIGQLKIILKKKVEQFQFQKTTKRIQLRLNNFIRQVFQKQQKNNSSDAMGARSWFCLSCDHELPNYTGKMIKGASTHAPQGKKVNKQSHMVRKNQTVKFPSVSNSITS